MTEATTALIAFCTAAGTILGGAGVKYLDYLKTRTVGEQQLEGDEAKFLRGQVRDLTAKVDKLQADLLGFLAQLARAEARVSVLEQENAGLRQGYARLKTLRCGGGELPPCITPGA